jgi:hypothetical protein
LKKKAGALFEHWYTALHWYSLGDDGVAHLMDALRQYYMRQLTKGSEPLQICLNALHHLRLLHLRFLPRPDSAHDLLHTSPAHAP